MNSIWVIVLLISLYCVGTAAEAAEQSSNLLKNPGFTEGLTGWNIKSPIYALSTDVGHNDKFSLHYSGTKDTPYALSTQSVPVQPGKSYIYSVWVKTANFTGEPNLVLEWFDGSRLVGGCYANSGVKPTADWQQIKLVSGPAPQEAKSANITLLVTQGAVGDAWFDDAELIKIERPPVSVEFPEPVWNGPMVYDLDGDPCIKLKCVLNTDSGIKSDDISIKASLVESDRVPLRGTADSDKWVNNTIQLSVPTKDLPLGIHTLAVEAFDKSTGRPIYRHEHEVTKIERIGIDIIRPSSMAIVGTNTGEKLELVCRLRSQIPKGVSVESSDVILSLVNLKGEELESPRVTKRIESGKPITVAFPMGDVNVGTYTLQAALYKPGSKIRQAVSKRMVTRVNPSDRPANATDVLPNGFMMVDGKLFFPQGIYMNSSTISVLPADKPWQFSWEHKNPAYYITTLDMLAKSPINCMIDYSFLAGGIEETKKFLDEVHKHGLKMIYDANMCPHMPWLMETFMKQTPWIDYESLARNNIRSFKNHPAVFAYYLNDEGFGAEMWPLFERSWRMTREEDPWHPQFSVQFNYQGSPAYSRGTDIYGTDPYSLMADIPAAVKSWKAAKEGSSPGQPIWAVVQTFGLGYEMSNPSNTREPTYYEMRCGAYCSLIEGATGIIYYCLHSMQRSPEFPRRWKELCSIASEVQSLVPILILQNAVKPAWVSSDKVIVSTKQDKNKLYAILANPERVNQSFVIHWPVGVNSMRDHSTGKSIPATQTIELAPLGALVIEAEVKGN